MTPRSPPVHLRCAPDSPSPAAFSDPSESAYTAAFMTDSKNNGPDQGLARFGYVQELFRSMGGFSNFAISFSIISVLTGAVTLFGYGLEMGGPLGMTLGWPLATIFTLTVAASMAELCSAYPTAGARDHWPA